MSVFKGERIQTKEGDEIDFLLNWDGLLLTYRNVDYHKKVDVVIPKVFPDGFVVKSISSYSCVGNFRKVTISDEICDIRCGAFGDAKIEEICWSAGCTTIPDQCFERSTLRKITNVANISEIGEYAFSQTNLEEIDLSGSKIMTIAEFAFFNCPKSSVIMPYYFSEEDKAKCF